jgi:hypothetical protein
MSMRVQADRGSFGLIQQTNAVKLVGSRSGATESGRGRC